MLIIQEATIETDDPAAELALDNLEGNGNFRVVHTGTDLSVSLLNENRRWTRVDYFTQASRVNPKGGGNTWSFQGTSAKLREENRLAAEDAVVSFSVTGIDGCPTCH